MPEPLPMPIDEAYYNDSNCCCIVTGDGTREKPYTILYCVRHEERPVESRLGRFIREHIAKGAGRLGLLDWGGRGRG